MVFAKQRGSPRALSFTTLRAKTIWVWRQQSTGGKRPGPFLQKHRITPIATRWIGCWLTSNFERPYSPGRSPRSVASPARWFRKFTVRIPKSHGPALPPSSTMRRRLRRTSRPRWNSIAYEASGQRIAWRCTRRSCYRGPSFSPKRRATSKWRLRASTTCGAILSSFSKAKSEKAELSHENKIDKGGPSESNYKDAPEHVPGRRHRFGWGAGYCTPGKCPRHSRRLDRGNGSTFLQVVGAERLGSVRLHPCRQLYFYQRKRRRPHQQERIQIELLGDSEELHPSF